eukprot:CAMPEP_0184290748 /NCGR_PEP_ID=MMETSP1049-20130417/2916_1 /TAXON_ID=77928 /ORGANISM="Proteomonas sulcata, Strain CCMP704" /LENGTH=73 /DNA_ID=CAMNT_0026597973 /DNA_START=66 /DNA_END=287 /DNA_ORIENTATION=+
MVWEVEILAIIPADGSPRVVPCYSRSGMTPNAVFGKSLPVGRRSFQKKYEVELAILFIRRGGAGGTGGRFWPT